MFLLWAGPGTLLSLILCLFTGQKIILIWNLVVSMYTICMEHALGMRQEDKDAAERRLAEIDN